jgi:2-keto-3-deoxy-L-rhamnonate aldolase RhmA
MTNAVSKLIENENTALCLCVRTARTVDVGAIAAAAGFDALYVDMEHSPITADDTSAICMAASGFGVTPFVRVPQDDIGLASRLLDGGAYGIIFPHVETAMQAAKVAGACLFPPRGTRSAVGSTIHLGFEGLSQKETGEQLDALTMTTVMIETELGVENADAIAAVDGVDMVMVGTADLSATMGVPGALDSPQIRQACEQVAAACRKSGKVFALGGVRNNPALAAKYAALGARFIIAGMDASYFQQAAGADVIAIRNALKS